MTTLLTLFALVLAAWATEAELASTHDATATAESQGSNDWPTYKLKVFVNLTQDGPHQATFGENLNPEGLHIVQRTMFISRYYNGTIWKVNQNGQLSSFAQFDNPSSLQLTGVETDSAKNVLVCVHDKDAAGNPTPYQGVWKIKKSGGQCTLTPTATCKKVFPLHGEQISFPDGIVTDSDDNVWVSDPDNGNIWKFNLDSTGPATLWAGTDAHSSPNFLQGIGFIAPVGAPFNVKGRGFGVNGLTIDQSERNIYGANAEGAMVVKIPIKNDGSAGVQKTIGTPLTYQYIFDGITFHQQKLYITAVGALTPTGLAAGQRIFGVNLKKATPTIDVIINDPLLGTPTDVVTGGKFDDPCEDDLFIADIAGFGLSQFGPNIIQAKEI